MIYQEDHVAGCGAGGVTMTQTDTTKRLALAKQCRILNLKTQIAQLEEELAALEECAGP